LRLAKDSRPETDAGEAGASDVLVGEVAEPVISQTSVAI
jgi:hypothetical protein